MARLPSDENSSIWEFFVWGWLAQVTLIWIWTTLCLDLERLTSGSCIWSNPYMGHSNLILASPSSWVASSLGLQPPSSTLSYSCLLFYFPTFYPFSIWSVLKEIYLNWIDQNNLKLKWICKYKTLLFRLFNFKLVSPNLNKLYFESEF